MFTPFWRAKVAKAASQLIQAGLWRGNLRLAIHRNQPKLHGIAILSLEIIHQALMAAPLCRSAVSNAALHALQHPSDELHPAAVIGNGADMGLDDNLLQALGPAKAFGPTAGAGWPCREEGKVRTIRPNSGTCR